jgi:4-amino-4-deoxy-L-arabinose transferase-like glycosyltransferase
MTESGNTAEMRQGTLPPPRAGRPTRIGLLLFAGALLLRLVYLAEARSDPLFDSPKGLGDAVYYDTWARAVARGEWLGPTPYFLAPLYQYVMGLLYALVGPQLLAVKLLQCVLGAASCALLYGSGRRLFGEAAGILAGVLLAVYPLHIFYSSLILPTILVVFLNLALLRVLVGGGEMPSPRRCLAAGALLGLACAAKPNALLLLPALALGLLWIGRGSLPRRALLGAAALALGTLLGIAPFTAHNAASSGEFVLLTTTGGRNLMKGNGPAATGTHVFLPPTRTGTGLQYHLSPGTDPAGAVADGRRMGREARRYMLEHPLRTMRLWAKKFMLFFNVRELFIRDQYYFARRYSRLLAFPLPGFAALAPLGLAGLAIAWRRGRRTTPLYVLLAAQVASFVALFVLARYRLVAICCLLLFAGHLVVEAIRALREGRWRSLVLPAAVAVAAALFAHLPFSEFPRERGFANQWERLGDHFWELGDRARAVGHYREGLRSDWLQEDPEPQKARLRLLIAEWENGSRVSE